MQCGQCGTMLQPGSAFCGGCGRPVAQAPQQQQQQYGYPPPPQQPPPQYGYPPPQHQVPQGYPPPHPQHGYAPPQQPGYAAPPSTAPLQPFPLVMQQKLTRLTGQMFVAPTRLYFICESQKGGLAVAIGKGVGGLIGGAIAAFGTPTPGQAAPVLDEAALFRAAQEMPGSLVIDPPKVKQIKHTMWWRGIWFDGKTYGLPNGLSKELRLELGRWCQANGVKNAGLT